MTSQFLVSLFLVTSVFGRGKVQLHEHWGYDHVEKWANVGYTDCASHDESPININTREAVIDESECVAKFDWDIDYNHTLFKIVNNGHSLQIIAEQLDEYSDFTFRRRLYNKHKSERRRLKKVEYQTMQSNYDTIATFRNYFAPTGSKHVKWCLDSFHFHWGSKSKYGSEHTIDGKYFPLEAHFVHFACDNINVGETLNTYQSSPDPHVLAVVGILFEISEWHNPAFDAILTDSVLEKIKLPDDLETVNITGYDIIDNLNLHDLIPENIESAGYYAYEGSLTTPPCTDIVRWFMMNARGTISEEQLEKLRTLLDAEGQPITPNYRPIQENVNGVWACISDGELQENGASNSKLFGAEIPMNATLNTISIVIISLGVVIFVLLICMVCYYARHQREKYGKNNEILHEQEIDGIVSDTEPDEPESDVLINHQ